MSVLAIAQESLSDIFVGEPREECGVVVKKWQRSLGIVGCALKTLGGIELRQSVSLHSCPPTLNPPASASSSAGITGLYHCIWLFKRSQQEFVF